MQISLGDKLYSVEHKKLYYVKLCKTFYLKHLKLCSEIVIL